MKLFRVGRKGSLSVGIEDTLSGRWFNFETGQHGDMLDLIQQYKVGVDSGKIFFVWGGGA